MLPEHEFFGRRQLALTAADKTVKLWKVHERKLRKVSCDERRSCREGTVQRDKTSLPLPQVAVAGTAVAASLRREFANAHAYHVNSIDPNCDGEHFMSADDLRINLWNLEVTDRSFSECKLQNLGSCMRRHHCR